MFACILSKFSFQSGLYISHKYFGLHFHCRLHCHFITHYLCIACPLLYYIFQQRNIVSNLVAPSFTHWRDLLIKYSLFVKMSSILHSFTSLHCFILTSNLSAFYNSFIDHGNKFLANLPWWAHVLFCLRFHITEKVVYLTLHIFSLWYMQPNLIMQTWLLFFCGLLRKHW